MDQRKIGAFIAEKRKEKGFTQKGLGDTLSVTDKAVSKWECGKGLPEFAVMPELCEKLGISVNELLSGERLSPNEYRTRTEQNLPEMLRATKGRKQNVVGGKTLGEAVNVAGNPADIHRVNTAFWNGAALGYGYFPGADREGRGASVGKRGGGTPSRFAHGGGLRTAGQSF